MNCKKTVQHLWGLLVVVVIVSLMALGGCKRQEEKTATVSVPATKPAPAVVEPALEVPQPATKVVSSKPGVRNVAIFILNHAGKQYDEKKVTLEDLVTSRISDMGFSVISRETSVDSISKTFGKETDLDKVLDKESSILRLAQNMNADYVFVATITTLGRTETKTSAYGNNWTDVTDKLRVSYKILDKFIGGTLTADVVEVKKNTRQTANSTTEVDFNDLFDDAAKKLAQNLQQKLDGDKIREVAGDSRKVDVVVSCTIQGLTVPDIVKNDKGDYVVSSTQLKIGAQNVTVSLNGTVLGTAPGLFKMPKGMSKIKLSRQGCKDWEQNISPTAGMTLNVDLEMSDDGLARWKEMAAFVQDLKSGEKLTDAQVELIKGKAQMFRQSGFKVDVQSKDLKTLNVLGVW